MKGREGSRTAAALAWLGGRRAALADWVIALSLAGLAELQLGVDPRCCGTGLTGGDVSFALTLAQTLPIAWRRRFPHPVLAVTGLAALVQTVTGGPSPDIGVLGVLVAYYTVAAAASRRFAIGLGAATAVGILVAKVFEPATAIRLDDLILIYAEFGAAWVLADNARWRRAHIANLEDRAARVEREEQYRAREAVARERARIARELHDVIADSLSVIMIQTGAARMVADRIPEQVDGCLTSIETVSREAWAELRHLLALERDGGGPDGEPALPGLEQLERLVGRFDTAGLGIDLSVSGQVRPLPLATDRCAYRVVQEALTNALKHSVTARAEVSIHYTGTCLYVNVTNDCPGRREDAPAQSGGHGLAGMRERVEQLGGELSVGSGERFTVHARLPIPLARP